MAQTAEKEEKAVPEAKAQTECCLFMEQWGQKAEKEEKAVTADMQGLADSRLKIVKL